MSSKELRRVRKLLRATPIERWEEFINTLREDGTAISLTFGRSNTLPIEDIVIFKDGERFKVLCLAYLHGRRKFKSIEQFTYNVKLLKLTPRRGDVGVDID